MSGLDYERLVLSAGPLGIMQARSHETASSLLPWFLRHRCSRALSCLCVTA